MFTYKLTTSIIATLITSSSLVQVLASPTPSLTRNTQLARSLRARNWDHGGEVCYPEFLEVGVAIFSYSDKDLKWGVPGSSDGAVCGSSSFRGADEPDWFVCKDEKYETSYVFKDIDNKDLAVAYDCNDESWIDIKLDTCSDDTETIIYELFDVACLDCYEPGKDGGIIADYCIVSPVGSNATECVEITEDGVKVMPCDYTSDSQVFTFTSW